MNLGSILDLTWLKKWIILLHKYKEIMGEGGVGSLHHRRNWTPVKSALRNSAEILVLGPNLCTRIWLYAMIGLLKDLLSICQSGWKEIWNVFLVPVICWVCWGPRTRISVLLHRCHWLWLNKMSVMQPRGMKLDDSDLSDPDLIFSFHELF